MSFLCQNRPYTSPSISLRTMDWLVSDPVICALPLPIVCVCLGSLKLCRIFFAVHILSIGMADLATQIYTVVLIVLPTILLVSKLGCDDSEWKPKIWSFLGIPVQYQNYIPVVQKGSPYGSPILKTCYIGSRLKAEVYEYPLSYDPKFDPKTNGLEADTHGREERRQDLYAWLALTYDEQQSMDKWDLFPHIRDGNHDWWQDYTFKTQNLKRTPGIALYEPDITLAVDDEKNPQHPRHSQYERRFSAGTRPVESPQALSPVEHVCLPTISMEENPAFPAAGGQRVDQLFLTHRAGTWPPVHPGIKEPRVTVI